VSEPKFAVGTKVLFVDLSVGLKFVRGMIITGIEAPRDGYPYRYNVFERVKDADEDNQYTVPEKYLISLDDIEAAFQWTTEAVDGR
jgi:hypothetical protein